MAAYVIANIRITDPDRYPEYASRVPQTIECHGGRYLARGGQGRGARGRVGAPTAGHPRVREMERLRGWYDSPEYDPLKQLREEVAVSRSSSSSKAYRLENSPRTPTPGHSVNKGTEEGRGTTTLDKLSFPGHVSDVT